jgi:hypothetical protein
LTAANNGSKLSAFSVRSVFEELAMIRRMNDKAPRVSREQIADPTLGIPHRDRLKQAGATDLRNNCERIEHGNGYATNRPVNPKKRVK